MLERVKATIHKYSMFATGDRVLVGVSGGPDSVALLHILTRLAAELEIEIFVAHLNHDLRGQEAVEDAEFVRGLAGQLGIRALVQVKDVAGYARENSLSIQVAARDIRYRFFVESAKQLGCNKLATGHNANDQAETVLFQFLRGSGTAGLGGIPPVRDSWIVRPLIETKRREIEQYCVDHGLTTRTDKSNLKTVYTRNKIRLDLFPLLEREYNINLVDTLLRTSEIMREQEEFLKNLALQAWDTVCARQEETELAFNLEDFLKLPGVVQTELLRYAWVKLTGSGYNLGYIHLTKSLDLLRTGQTGSMMDLPAGIKLIKSYSEFCLAETGAMDAANLRFYHTLKVPGITPIPETGDAIETEILAYNPELDDVNTSDEILLDMESISLPLIVRTRKPGERFRPRGQLGSKKIKKFLIDSKISRRERARLPVIVDGDDQVIWLAGLRADERWRVNRETKNALKLKLIRKAENKNED